MRRRALVAVLVIALLVGGVGFSAMSAVEPAATEAVYSDSTFSIVAFDPATRELGVIVQTFRPAVGNRCPWVQAGVGAVATQAWTNPLLATKVLDLLAHGLTAERALATAIAEDELKDRRQIIVVDHMGNVAGWTGNLAPAVAGHILGDNFAVAGNILLEGTLEAMAAAFEDSTGPLAFRLLEAMKAGQEAGGDSRGKMSIGLRVARVGWVPFVDLRVDHHIDPFAELARILDVGYYGYRGVAGLGWDNPDRAPQLGYRRLQVGAKGEDVRHIQVMLRDLGHYAWPIDGVFGGRTALAVMSFQEAHGLERDGIVFGDTLTKLIEAYLALE